MHGELSIGLHLKKRRSHMLAACTASGIRAITLHTLDRVLAFCYLNDVALCPLHVEGLRIRILCSFF